MTRLSTFVASAAVVALAVPGIPASAQPSSIQIPKPETTLAQATRGTIQGVVLDGSRRPLAGAMVSALGSTVGFALTGRDGRFALDALPVGAYTVRVHLDGFLPSRRQVVEVRGGRPSIVSVAMQTLASPAATIVGTPVLVAGVSPFGAAPVPIEGGSGESAKEGDDVAGHDHSEAVWRLRHLKRSVLKNVDGQVATGDAEPATDDGNVFGRAFESSLRFASALFTETPLTGQVNFITTGSFGSDSEPWSPDAFAVASVAYVALGAPVGGWGQWDVRGAMRQGEMGSWFLAGTFNGRVAGAHRYTGGLSYGSQRVEQANLFGRAAINGGSRSTGTVYGVDEWTVGRRVAVSYGVAYAWQDYVASGGLLSPRVSLTLSPTRQFRVRAVASRYAAAPGAEELLPASTTRGDGVWLPAQRSFSAWSGVDGFQAQTTDHFEIGVERVANEFLVGFRSYYQRIDDQMGVVFAAPTLSRPAASLGHYYVTNAGDVSARGWSISVSRPILAGVRGSVDYAQTTTRWAASVDSENVPAMVAASRSAIEKFHDLTTSLQTDIPQTATRVYVLYRINSAFASEEPSSVTPGLDARFDIQVNQGLPFLDFTSAEWEVLVAVRNLFRDPTGERSVFDELLVVRPPTRVVGGVRVRF